jgi:hypothetical protein
MKKFVMPIQPNHSPNPGIYMQGTRLKMPHTGVVDHTASNIPNLNYSYSNISLEVAEILLVQLMVVQDVFPRCKATLLLGSFDEHGISLASTLQPP